MLVDKQTYFENHHHQKHQEIHLNHMLTVSLFYLALLLILLLSVMLQILLLKSEFLRG